jgi:acyl-CoA synthetase (AMP-forming)/AMP-acid ligase II
MGGYWTRENKSNKSTRAKNNHDSYPWVITNDLGYLDDRGGLYFCSRLKDVIRTGGESVFAPEVEDVLLQHPDIESCAVFGLPHDRFGECVTAAIVWKKSSHVNHDSQKSVEPFYLLNESSKRHLRDYCEERGLSRYKAPMFIFVSDELPRNSSGKLMKHELVKMCEIFNSSRYINSKSKL